MTPPAGVGVEAIGPDPRLACRRAAGSIAAAMAVDPGGLSRATLV
jgi:hypothetical protein